jgi:hypothetical protein
MTARMRLWAVVAVAYVSARVLIRVLTSGALAMEAAFIAELVIVPAAQIAALELVRAWLWPGALDDEDSCAS